MLNTTDAYRYAFSEIRKRPVFWIPIAILYVLLGSIQDNFPTDWILTGIILFSEIILYIVIASVSIKAIANKDYDLMDIFLDPTFLFKATILSSVIIFLCCILVIPIIFIFVSVFMVKISFSFIIGITIVIAMVLLTLFVLTRLFFAQYYFLDKKESIWQSLQASWKNSNYKVSLSILSYILWMIALSSPLHMLDKVLSGIYLHSYHLIVPIGVLAGVHMYTQLQNKKNPI